jgi:hypothetical protein
MRVAVVVFCAVPLFGAPTTPAVAGDRWQGYIVNLEVENDKFANTDRHYTNGIRLSALSPKRDITEWARRFRLIPFLPPDSRKREGRLGFYLGQNMYTPENTEATTLIENDRPYAGWLYVGVGFAMETDAQRLDTVELDIGMVGPASLAEKTQKWWHEVIDVEVPRGWDNQLNNEPGFVLSYERKWRRFLAGHLPEATGPLSWPAFDVTPYVGGSIGNVFTYAAAGGMVRFGDSLRDDYGPPRIRPSMPGSAFFDRGNDFGWYVYAGVEGRLVARNIFLDGNTFTHSHRVDKKPIVGDLQVGAVVIVPLFGHPVRLSYTQVLRTKEFEVQREKDYFGAISLSFRF